MNYRSNLVLAIAMALTLIMPIALAADVFQFGGSTGGGGCEYNVGDTIQLPQISTPTVADYDTSDGHGYYMYCIYEARDGNGNVVYSDTTPMTGGENDSCPKEQLSMDLTYGDNTWNVVISGISMNYVADGWRPSSPEVLANLSETYNACYPAPSPDFVEALVSALMSFICDLFPFFSFCGGI